MSKIDQLLHMVDSLTQRSDSIVGLISESNGLVSLILELNSTINAADSQIDTMTDLISKNNFCLNEFEKLFEKLFFLESNLHRSEAYTNEASLDALNREYDYLLATFSHHNGRHFAPKPEEPKPEELKPLNHMLSLSNLNLKPLRCRSTKVSKQKSRYRLSAAYTLNPLAESRSVSKSSQETYDSLMDQDRSYESEETSQGERMEKSRVEDLGLDDSFALAGSDSFAFAVSDKPDDTFGSLDKDHTFGSINSEALSAPLFAEAVDVSDMDSFSDSSLELDSPSKEVDNFHHFLRQSRVDLRTAFPMLHKSRSHESVFSEQETLPPKFAFHNPADILHTQKGISQATVQPIYSSSFEKPPISPSLSQASLSQASLSHFKEHSSHFKEQSSKLLPEDSPTKPCTPKKTNFTLFSLLNSPLGSPRLGNATGRRSSVSKSLTASFMHLVGPSTQPGLSGQDLGPLRSPSCTSCRPSPPEKIKKLRKGLRDPIQIPNDISTKRLPPSINDRQLRNGGHSSLTISNKKKVINHGEVSLFKKPPVRGMSLLLLRDALHESLLF